MFVLYAEKNQLTVREKEPVTSGSVNVYPVRFEFSSDWDGLTKAVMFQSGCAEKTLSLTGGACTIPPEVLDTAGYFLIAGVCGKSGDSIVLPTVWANLGLIQEGAVSLEDIPPDIPDPPPSGTIDHRQLSHRDAAEQHPITSISGLDKELQRIPEPVEALTNTELEDMLK